MIMRQVVWNECLHALLQVQQEHFLGEACARQQCLNVSWSRKDSHIYENIQLGISDRVYFPLKFGRHKRCYVLIREQ